MDETPISDPEDIEVAIQESKGKHGVKVVCPSCGMNQTTDLTHDTGIITWLSCLICVFFGLWLGCFLLPFYRQCSKDVIHKCSQCKETIGRYSRM